MTNTHSKTLIMFDNAFGPDGFGLEWIAQEWISGELVQMAEAAEAFGLNEIATALRAAIPLQKQMLNGEVPGDIDGPAYLAWEARIGALNARILAAGGAESFRKAAEG